MLISTIVCYPTEFKNYFQDFNGMPKKGTEITPKQEKFCQLYLELGNASEAYKQSHDVSPDTTKASIRSLACSLKNKMRNRIAELREDTAKAAMWSRADSIKVLTDIATGVDPEAKASDKVQAVKTVNAMFGWDKQTIDHTSSDGSMSPPTRIELVAPKSNDD